MLWATLYCSFAKQHFWLVHRKQGLPRRPETVFTLDGAKRAIITVKLLHFTTIEPRPFPKRGSRHVTTSESGSHMRRWIALEPGAILLSYQCGLLLIELWSGYRFVGQSDVKWQIRTSCWLVVYDWLSKGENTSHDVINKRQTRSLDEVTNCVDWSPMKQLIQSRRRCNFCKNTESKSWYV